jgi:hypothetical protein
MASSLSYPADEFPHLLIHHLLLYPNEKYQYLMLGPD